MHMSHHIWHYRLHNNSLIFLCPARLSQWHLLSWGSPTPIGFRSPRPILTKPDLSIRSIIEIDLRYLGLDDSPYPPVKTRNTSKYINLIEKALNLKFLIYGDLFVASMFEIASDVLTNKVETLWLCWKEGMFAIKSAPFGKVIRKIKGRRRWCSVLVVDETYGFGCDRIRCASRLYYHIAAQQVAMSKD